jgi:hypothetical protein
VWRYRCDSCRTTSLPVRTRAEALDERDMHRRRRHGSHVPDGEHLQRTRRSRAAPRPAAPGLDHPARPLTEEADDGVLREVRLVDQTRLRTLTLDARKPPPTSNPRGQSGP